MALGKSQEQEYVILSASNHSSYPSNVKRVCRLSGVDKKLLEGQLLSLQESETFLVQTIREGKAASSQHEIFQALELGARATVMICDILVVSLESATGPAGYGVSKLYDGAKLVVDAAMSGNMDSTTGLILLAKNKAKITELSAKQLGAGKFAKSLQLATELAGYGEAMWGLFSGVTSMKSGGNSGIKTSIRTATVQLERIRAKISEISAELQSCAKDDPQVSHFSIRT